MTVFRVSRTHVAVLKLEGVNEGEGKGEGSLGEKGVRGQSIAAVALTTIGSFARHDVTLYTKTSAAAHHRERGGR